MGCFFANGFVRSLLLGGFGGLKLELKYVFFVAVVVTSHSSLHHVSFSGGGESFHVFSLSHPRLVLSLVTLDGF